MVFSKHCNEWSEQLHVGKCIDQLREGQHLNWGQLRHWSIAASVYSIIVGTVELVPENIADNLRINLEVQWITIWN
jgi:hypothetical protein